MKRTWRNNTKRSLDILQIFIACFMIIAGVLTPFKEPENISGTLGIVYNNHLALVVFGVVFFISGVTLMYGRVKQKSSATGLGLMMVFGCFLFASILESVARHTPSIGNISATVIVAVLYLWWRFETAYFTHDQLNSMIKDI